MGFKGVLMTSGKLISPNDYDGNIDFSLFIKVSADAWTARRLEMEMDFQNGSKDRIRITTESLFL